MSEKLEYADFLESGVYVKKLEETYNRYLDIRDKKLVEFMKENKRLHSIIKELEEYLIEQVEKSYSDDYDNVLDKLDELKGNNEPSFEEMVGFVENVCKDIKNQSTLHEELEEERKTIAKIVGNFKEVINNE